jgi:uncharacterized protein YbjT (DUF2867 family)
MSRIAIVGGHGKISRLLIPLLVAQGHEVVALHRKPEQAERLSDLGAEPRRIDIEADSVEAFADAFAGCDAVVFSAGGGPDGNADRKWSVDLGGALKSIEAATRAGVSRFVQVSAISVDALLPEDTTPIWKAYVDAKRYADMAVRASTLDWTIVRPGGLTDDPATGRVQADERVPRAQIPRADVAQVIAHVLAGSHNLPRQFEVVGGATPIDSL